MEAWRAIPGHSGYEVSDHGRVRSIDRWVVHAKHGKAFYRGRILRPQPNSGGYLQVNLGIGILKRIAPLVMLAFVGPCPAGLEACHNDNNKLNNRLSNLRYGTRSSNQMDRVVHGTSNRGERHSLAKLTRAQVKAIRLSDKPASELAVRYDVTESTIGDVRRRKSWFWLDPAMPDRIRFNKRGEKNGNSKLTNAEVRRIRTSKAANDLLAARFGVSNRTIRNIRADRSRL